MHQPAGNISARAFARIGLLGNPSDGFNGKTISISLANFWAEVSLTPSDTVSFVPHPKHDGYCFASLDALSAHVKDRGFYGGVRLLLATCKVFQEFCQAQGITLGRKNFTLAYDTNIPRQTGLSGSSAIVCAALKCLLKYYSLEDRVPKQLQPNLVLKAEQELGIAAGLQDRVIQVYQGLVAMDFNSEHMKLHGHGIYTPLDPALLPALWLVYDTTGSSDSGAVHSDVKRRWAEGDEQLRQQMAQVAELAEAGRQALCKCDYAALARLMDENFNLRRAIYGDAVLGAGNLRMISACRSTGAAAKFTGSGGAVVVLCTGGQQQEQELQAVATAAGYGVTMVRVALPTP